MPASMRVRMPCCTNAGRLAAKPCAFAIQSRVWMSRRPPGQLLMFGSNTAPEPCDLAWRCSISTSFASINAATLRCAFIFSVNSSAVWRLPNKKRASKNAVSPVISSRTLSHSSSTLPLLTDGASFMSHKSCTKAAIFSWRSSETVSDDTTAKSKSE